jgi:hypothetical protein
VTGLHKPLTAEFETSSSCIPRSPNARDLGHPVCRNTQQSELLRRWCTFVSRWVNQTLNLRRNPNGRRRNEVTIKAVAPDYQEQLYFRIRFRDSSRQYSVANSLVAYILVLFSTRYFTRPFDPLVNLLLCGFE